MSLTPQTEFQSTPPREGGDLDNQPPPFCFFLISIHAPREGGDTEYIRWGYDFIDISIHAPREGGDLCSTSRGYTTCISIHAPREGGDGAVPANAG